VRRHASAFELASLDLGGLRRRKAARISAHLSTCVQCTQTNNQLGSVQTTLASASAHISVSIPPDLSARVSGALQAESNQRLGSQTPTEAGRRDLPQRSRLSRPAPQRAAGSGYRRLRLSGTPAKVIAGVGALAVIGGVGYAIGSNVGSGTGTTASSGPAATNQPMRAGPKISYQHSGRTKTITELKSNTDFAAGTLITQVKAALTEALQRHEIPSADSGAAGAPGAAASPRGSGSTAAGVHTVPNTAAMTTQLSGCVNRLAAGQQVILVESAKYQGSAATIVVTGSASPGQKQVWVVGPSCSPTNSDVLKHATFSGT
jgi:hypothetical protein